MTSEKTKAVNPNPDYRDRDIRVRNIVIFLVAMGIVCGGTMVGMLYYLGRERRNWQQQWGDSPQIISSLPEGLRLQVNEKADLLEQRAYENQELRKTEWVDKDAGIARISIDDAMALVEEIGWEGSFASPTGKVQSAETPTQQSVATDNRP
ncbi:MAG: hypothetical protein KJ626_00525 [Verrucomicrobia bacterium]|nr:hypothetical protein [Verrucomicrobiota bacterium]